MTYRDISKDLDEISEMVRGRKSPIGAFVRSLVEKISTDAEGRIQSIEAQEGCPCAAREKLDVSAQAVQMNEKMLKARQEALEAELKKSDADPAYKEKVQTALNGVIEKRKINTQNMDRVEDIAANYAVAYKPGDGLTDRRAHALFLKKHRERIEEKLKTASAGDFPDAKTLEVYNIRLKKITDAEAENEKWFAQKDPNWIKVSKASSGTDKEVVAKEKENLKPKESAQGAEPQKKAEGQPTGAAGSAPAPQKQAEPEWVRVAKEANPGDTWKTSKGKFGAKGAGGEVGNGRKGVRYFETQAAAKSYAAGEAKSTEVSTSKRKKSTVKKESIGHDVLQNYLEETYRDSGLGKWFRQSADDTPGWDRYNSKGERAGKCGDADEGEAYAACLSPEKAEKLGKEGIASFVRRKRAAQRKAGMGKKGQGEAGGGEEPVRVSTGIDKVKEEWSQEYKDSIDCENPKGFSQRAHCQGKEKDMKEAKEISGEELKDAVKQLIELIKMHEKLAYEAKKAGNMTEYKKHRGHIAEFSADIKTVQDLLKRAMDKRAMPITEEEDGEEGKPLNKPFRTPGEKKKFAVYVRNDNGNIVKVRFGDPNMEIKRDDPGRLKAFRSRHSCDDDVGPKWKARYWSCQMWRSDKSVDDILSEASENEPTNPQLWDKVQDLVAGRIGSMEHNGETIEGPNGGKGFDVHPSAYSNAWASKLYKRLGGDWRKVSEEKIQSASMSSTVKAIVENNLRKKV